MDSENPVSFLKTKEAYCDYKSKEESTGKIKKKFKLAGKPIDPLGIYPFFIINGSDSALIKSLTISIKKDDWEWRDKKELQYEFSYIDISDFISHTIDDILGKRNDPKNGFPYVGTLCQRKYNELRNRVKKFRNPYVKNRIPKQIQKNVCLALGVSDEIKRKIGLD